MIGKWKLKIFDADNSRNEFLKCCFTKTMENKLISTCRYLYLRLS